MHTNKHVLTEVGFIFGRQLAGRAGEEVEGCVRVYKCYCLGAETHVKMVAIRKKLTTKARIPVSVS